MVFYPWCCTHGCRCLTTLMECSSISQAWAMTLLGQSSFAAKGTAPMPSHRLKITSLVCGGAAIRDRFAGVSVAGVGSCL